MTALAVTIMGSKPTRRHKCQTCAFVQRSPSDEPCSECCLIIMNRKAGKELSYWKPEAKP